MSLTGSGAAAPSLWELLARSLTKSAARFLKCIAQAADPPPPPTKAVCVRKLLAGFRPPVFLEPL